jgi:hypothetical protein
MRQHIAFGTFVFLLLFVINAASQNSSTALSIVSGTVTDPTGATLPLARVMLVNLKTLQTQTVEVREDGKFRFPDRTPGEFALIVAGPGDPHAACWKPSIRQLDTRKTPTLDLRITLSLDLERCPGIIN